MVSYREISEILTIIDRIDCESLVLECDDLTLSVSRADGVTSGSPLSPPPPAVEARVEPQPTVDTAEPQDGWSAVRAPMVGTFYRNPAPDQPPFVDVGTRVSAGQVVGLIEVMKLFTELKAECAGTVVRVDAADGALVEYDQPVVWVEPS